MFLIMFYFLLIKAFFFPSPICLRARSYEGHCFFFFFENEHRIRLVEHQSDIELALHSKIKENQGLESCLRWEGLMGIKEAVQSTSPQMPSMRRPPPTICQQMPLTF